MAACRVSEALKRRHVRRVDPAFGEGAAALPVYERPLKMRPDRRCAIINLAGHPRHGPQEGLAFVQCLRHDGCEERGDASSYHPPRIRTDLVRVARGEGEATATMHMHIYETGRKSSPRQLHYFRPFGRPYSYADLQDEPALDKDSA